MTDTNALREWIEGVIAGKKQPVALMVVGDAASGKTLFARELMERVGSTDCVMVDAMPKTFNGELVGKRLVVLDEFRGDLERLKPYITSPTIEVVRKGWEPVEQDNPSNYLLLVNTVDDVGGPFIFATSADALTTIVAL